MSETNDSQPSSKQPTPAPKTLPNSTPPGEPTDESELIEQLIGANEALHAQLSESQAVNELLRIQLEASEQARIIAEARVLHLSTVVEESAQDLQQFGENYFVPASITSITRGENGVCMNGIPLGSEAMNKQDDPTVASMRRWATLVNAQKAALRQKAQLTSPEPKSSRQSEPRSGSSLDSGDA